MLYYEYTFSDQKVQFDFNLPVKLFTSVESAPKSYIYMNGIDKSTISWSQEESLGIVWFKNAENYTNWKLNATDFKYKEKGGRPRNFRSDLLTRCKRLANQFYQSLGSMPELEKTVVQRTALLRSWKWTDSTNSEFKADRFVKDLFPKMTILESFDVKDSANGGEEDYGIALNPVGTRAYVTNDAPSEHR